jgi:hypothetical protein
MCGVICSEVGFIMFSSASQCARHLLRQARYVRAVTALDEQDGNKLVDAVEELAETRARLFGGVREEEARSGGKKS